MNIRMWEAVAADGRLADLESAAAAIAAGPGERIEASTDGVSRVVVMVWSEDEPTPAEAGLDPELFERAHAWVFTRL